MSLRPIACSVLVAVFSMPPLCGGAVDREGGYWTQFRGPNRDGVSPETGLLRKWPEEGPRLLWTAGDLGHGFATASIAAEIWKVGDSGYGFGGVRSMTAGMIYTAGDRDGKTLITALDLQGRMRWQTPNGPGWVGTQPGHPGARGVPTFNGDRVFHLSPFGNLVALDARTGERLWELNILEKFESSNINWALSASVLVDGDRVIVAPGGKRTAVVALDRRTGQVVWESPSVGGLAGYGSPILAEHQGLRMVITLTDKELIAVRASDGGLLWRFPHETQWDENIFTPIHRQGRVFVSTQFTGSVLLQVRVNGNDATVEEVWRSKNLDNHHGGAVLLGGHVYGSGRANDGRWACLCWETGELKHAERGVGKGSVVAADGMLYTLSERGVVGLVPATPERHEVVSQFRIPEGGKGPVFAHPVVCGGRLYLRHGQFLYCYDLRSADR